MRISDGSSDVCSSDLSPGPSSLSVDRIDRCRRGKQNQAFRKRRFGSAAGGRSRRGSDLRPILISTTFRGSSELICCFCREPDYMPRPAPTASGTLHNLFHMERSEEHTSELQSLMRISYAVLCLKKKTTKT